MNLLSLSPDLKLPLNAVTEKLAFLGRTGSGKTYAAQLLAEQMLTAKAQIIVLDPVGVWFSLRLGADGKSPAFPIPVFGGLRGDIPLEASGGVLIANLIADRGISAVIDVSQFEHDTDKARFARAFAERFYFRKKSDPSAVHFFIEECQEFVPQNPQGEEAKMLHAFTRMLKIGRNFGIGASMLSQRPQEVNKKCLNLAEILLAFQMTGPHERKTVEGWIADKGIKEDIAGELPKLAVGHPHVWSPALLKMSRVVAIDQKSTFDASSTPKVGAKQAARELSPIDLAQLRTEMAATIERAKQDDPKELRKRITELEKSLQYAERGGLLMAEKLKEKIQPTIERVEIPVLTEQQLIAIKAMSVNVAFAVEQFHDAAKILSDALSKAYGKPVPTPARRPSDGTVKPRVPQIAPTRVQRRTDSSIGVAERAFLTVLFHRKGAPTRRDQLAVLAQYSPKSRHVDNTLGSLRSAGYVHGPRDALAITPAGEIALGAVEPMPTVEALVNYWCNKMGAAGGAMLRELVDSYPDSMTRDELAIATNYSPTSRHVDNTIGALRTRELIEGGRNDLRASRTLMEG